MVERPAIFSGAMVRSLLDGSKSQTRRIARVWPPVTAAGAHLLGWVPAVGKARPRRAAMVTTSGLAVDDGSLDGGLAPLPAARVGEFCPYGRVGDRLWVRETWCSGDAWVKESESTSDPPEVVRYRADNAALRYVGMPEQHSLDTSQWSAPKRWRSAIHMPRWASRLLLGITSVGFERLRDITDEDIAAEGVRPFSEVHPEVAPTQLLTTGERVSDNPLRASLAVLWDEIHGERLERQWLANPWVFVVRFERVKELPGE